VIGLNKIRASIIGGIIGGIVLGIMMQMTGKIPVIAGMFGSDSLLVGWVIHMVISIIFAIGYGLLVFNNNKYILVGILHGVLIWIIGPLLIMPLMMGMGVMFASMFTAAMLMSLMTHIMFSLIVAITVLLCTKLAK
jgi:uncharacterized membrane protein YagU involved in acid resistance